MFSGKEIVDSLIQHTQHNSTSKQEGIQRKDNLRITFSQNIEIDVKRRLDRETQRQG